MTGDGGKNPNDPHTFHSTHHAHIKAADPGMPVSQIVIVGLIIAVLGGGGLWYLNRAGEDNKLNSLFSSSEARKISTSMGQRGDITLSDGSTLNIGPATKLTIIPDYNKQYRGVKVEGTAKFDVKPSSGAPLEVRAGGGVFVLNEGAFVIRSYDDEGGVTFKLTTGTVQMRAKDVRRDVTAPAALHIGKDSSVSDAEAGAVEIATAWADGKVIFRDLPLGDVLPLFNRYYAMTIDVKDKSLLTRRVTMEAALDSKLKAIAALEASAFVKFAYDGQAPVLRDDPAAAAKAAKAAKK